jgi:hypothetical protein
METSEVRKRLRMAIDRAKSRAAERRTRTDEAGREFAAFLNEIAVPLFRQTANVLKVEGYPFTVFTPGGSVRLMSDRAQEDFVELSLDTSGARPAVIGHSSRARGGRVVEAERPIGGGAVREISEEQVLEYLLEELESIVGK